MILLTLKLLGLYLLIGLACVPVLFWMAGPRLPTPLDIVVEDEPENNS